MVDSESWMYLSPELVRFANGSWKFACLLCISLWHARAEHGLPIVEELQVRPQLTENC